MKNNFYRILIILIIFAAFNYAQEDRVVAQVGNYKIYESEFKDRFDFTAHPKLLSKSDKEAAKLEFLKQLIAEKLLALDAEKKGLNNEKEFKDILKPLENMFVRDELYKNEIKDKVKYTTSDIKDGIEKIKKKLALKFIYSDKRNELDIIFQELNKGASFDSILALRAEFQAQNSIRLITFGDMDKKIEDEVYKLKPGEYTSVLNSEDGFYILKLISAADNQDLKDNANTLEDVKRIVETRIEREKYLKFYHDFFSKYKVTADKRIFEKLIKIFVPKFADKYADKNLVDGEKKYYLRGGEIKSVIDQLDSESVKSKFIHFEKKSENVEYFLNALSQDGFFVQSIDEKSIRSSLSSYIRKFIEDELLTLEGIKKSLQNNKDVKKNIGMWRDYYLSQMQMTAILDSINVSDDELYSIYQKNNWEEVSPQKVNIIEVLTDKLENVEIVLRKLSEGEDIRSLARQYTVRDSLKNKGGEFGFFPVTENGELGKIASQMKIGEIYGPIKLEEGYSIFQLIGKKTDTTSTYLRNFDEVKQEIKMKLILSRFEKAVNEYNYKLANKFGVKIFENVLNDIEDIYLNLIVVRKMGFGGEIFAVPYTQQFPGWYELWIKEQNRIP